LYARAQQSYNVFQKRTWLFIHWGATGLDPANSSRKLPSWTLEEGRIPHHIHIDRGNNFKITPSSAWVYLLICLAGSGIWATYSSDWWWAINSTSIAYMLLGMLFLGVWGNLHLSLKSLIWMGKGLIWDLLSWVSLVKGKDKDSYKRIFFFLSPLDKDVNIAYPLILGPSLMDPFSLLLLLGFGWNSNSLSGIWVFFFRDGSNVLGFICFVLKKLR